MSTLLTFNKFQGVKEVISYPPPFVKIDFIQLNFVTSFQPFYMQKTCCGFQTLPTEIQRWKIIPLSKWILYPWFFGNSSKDRVFLDPFQMAKNFMGIFRSKTYPSRGKPILQAPVTDFQRLPQPWEPKTFIFRGYNPYFGV